MHRANVFFIRQVLAGLLILAQLLFSVAYAEQLQLPLGDVKAPQISEIKDSGETKEGSPITISATVTDDRGVDYVLLYYRKTGDQAYTRLDMEQYGAKDFYTATIPASAITKPGIEYYIQAYDNAGNSVLDGASFSPNVVQVVPTTSPPVMKREAISIVSHPSSQGTEPVPTEKKANNKKWLWIGIGVAVLAAAAGGGGGGGDSNTGAQTIDQGSVLVEAPIPF